MTQHAYRPDIDGLRAVAVLLVVLFHAELGFPGGYVGVDVFFVISGYLITGIILRDLANGSFSLSDFWVRRVRRIVPASLLMMLVTLLFGAWCLFPVDFEELGASALTQPVMASNIYFWQKTGYFDGPADLKPLLHTWSLAVEEQFYLLYPLLLAGIVRTAPRWLFATLSLLAMLSFGASVWGVNHIPSATFFLLPFRAWEMLLGGLLCALPAPSPRRVVAIQCAGLVGFSSIAIPTLLYHSNTPFPGLAAVLPCAGTVVLLYANGHPQSWLRSVLARPLLVHIGQISYSLYLWHWPLLVYLKYRQTDDLTYSARWLAVAASFLVAELSWRWIETPFRHGFRHCSRRAVWTTCLSATGVVLLMSWAIQHEDGFPNRFSPEMQRLLETMKHPRYQRTVPIADVSARRLPEFGDKAGQLRCLIWGDSHAMALIPALDEVCRELHIRGSQATYAGTLPLVDFTSQRSGCAPAEYDEAVLKLILEDRYSIVILAGFWTRDCHDPDFCASLKETVDELTRAGAHVILLRDVPIQHGNTGSLIAAPLRQGLELSQIGIELAEHRQFQQTADTALLQLVGKHVTLADPTPYFLDENDRCRVVLDGECLYSDRHHISLAGARRLKPLLHQLLSSYRPAVTQRIDHQSLLPR